jgi:pyruvate-formate lyase-activating enzyme
MTGRRLLNNTPSYYTYYMTFRCNLKCTMCYQRDQRKQTVPELSLPQAIAMLEGTAKLERVNLIGGEVFVRPDVLDLMEYLDARGVVTYVTTNGSLLDDDKIARLLSLRHLLGVTVSLTALGDRYRAICGGRVDSAAILDTIRQLARGTQVRVNSVLLAEDATAFAPLIQAIGRARASLLKVQLQITHSPWVIEQTEEYASTWMGRPVTCLYPRETRIWDARMLEAALHHVQQAGRQCGLPVLIFPSELTHYLDEYAAETLWMHYHLGCEGARRLPRIKVLPNGDAVFCEGLDITLGNLCEQTPDEIWNSPELSTFYDEFSRAGGLPICGRCCRVVVGPRRVVPMG